MYYILWLMFLFLFVIGVRSLKGPTHWDRLMGMNLITTKIIVIIVLYASVSGIEYLLDFAIIYALTGFISTIFIASFLKEAK